MLPSKSVFFGDDIERRPFLGEVTLLPMLPRGRFAGGFLYCCCGCPPTDARFGMLRGEEFPESPPPPPPPATPLPELLEDTELPRGTRGGGAFSVTDMRFEGMPVRFGPGVGRVTCGPA